MAWIARIAAVLAILSTPFVSGCDGRPRGGGQDGEALTSVGEDHLAELDLRSGVPEEPATSLFAGPGNTSFTDLVARLRSMPDEQHLKGVFVRFGASLGLARGEEIGRHLAGVRAKGIPVVCHANGYDNSTMLVAALSCDEIFLSPAGTVDTVGLAGQLFFGRALLDRLHVEVDFLQVGKFKGAKEPFTNEEASPEARGSLQETLAGVRRAWLDGLEKGRKKSPDALGVEDGPHTAEQAKALGLIDELGFLRDARKRALERAGVSGRVDYFGGTGPDQDGFAGLVRLLSGASGSTVPHIAVVRASGAITMAGGGSIFSATGITEASLGKLLRRLETNESTKAVVLRIDSPGGSALASDLLWRALMDLRAHKPVVVSIGSMAASGGYYLACAANEIVAERTSIIGSIGVVAGKLSYGASLRELGVNVEAVPAKEGADPSRALLGSPFSGWDEATRAKLQGTIEGMYELFLARIAEGRGIDRAKLDLAAEGRIMSGDAARDAGLIDQIGGLSRAIDVAIELAGVDASTPIDIVRVQHGLLGVLGVDGARAQAAALHDIEERAAERARGILTGGLLPFRSEITAFGASATPLLEGERLLVALPFALAVR